MFFREILSEEAQIGTEGEAPEAPIAIEGEVSENTDENADVNIDPASIDETASADQVPTSPQAPWVWEIPLFSLIGICFGNFKFDLAYYAFIENFS